RAPGSSIGPARSNRSTGTPFGTISNRPPRREAAKRSATLETATRTEILRASRRSAGAAISNSRDLVAPEWNVATTGASEASNANIDVLGVIGSWTWTTSGRNRRTSSATRRADPGQGQIGATERL